MNFIKTHIEDHVFHILMDRGKSNALHLEMVLEISMAIDEAANDPSVEGLILTGKEGFFSAGLDLITLYSYDEAQMKTFWEAFMALLYKLITFPKPAVSAITGHSPAGGCVLAICCDYRIMADGDFIIGLNEVPVGLIVPQSIFKLYSFWLGEAVAYRSLLQGKLFKPLEAKDVALVDEIVAFNRIQNAAMHKMKSVMQFEKHAWRTSKLNFRKDLIAAFQKDQTETISKVLEQWWRPSTRAILKTIIENLTQKKG